LQNIIKLSAAVYEVYKVVVYTNLFALSRNGKQSENPVLWA